MLTPELDAADGQRHERRDEEQPGVQDPARDTRDQDHGRLRLQRAAQLLLAGQPGPALPVLTAELTAQVAPGNDPARRVRLLPPARRRSFEWLSTSRLVGSSRIPAMVSSMLLPGPLGPITATIEPSSTGRLTSASACTPAVPCP